MQPNIQNEMYPVFSDYQRQCDEELFSRFSLAELKEWKRVVQSMRKSLKNDCGGASIFFVYSLAATITVILLEICQMMDTSIESHFESSGQSTSLDSQETTAILQNAMNDRHIWLQAFVSDFAALLFAFSFSAAVLNDINSVAEQPLSFWQLSIPLQVIAILFLFVFVCFSVMTTISLINDVRHVISAYLQVNDP